jgi:hypothetical protein
MSVKSNFDEAEWDLVAEAPVTAGMIVLTADSGGTFRETLALARSYTDARNQHGQSELLDEIVSAKPEFDRHRYHSTRELHDAGLDRIAKAVAVVGRKGTPQELSDYREFVVALASKVATAHKEEGEEVSPAEQAALNEIRDRLEQASA